MKRILLLLFLPVILFLCGAGVPEPDFDLLPPPENADFSPYLVTVSLAEPLPEFSVTSPFGWRFHPISGSLDFHTGTDLSCPEGTPVCALLGGNVLRAKFHESYGNYILLDHGNGFQTLYAHCKKLTVKEGETVRSGQKIALSGQTGEATGPHLHLEIRMNDCFLNPGWLPFLQNP